MGHRTREEVPDDEDDLLADDLDGDDAATDEPLPRPLLDDELLDELDALAEPGLDRTLDEFVVDPALLRDDDGTALPDESWADDAPPGELPTLPWSAPASLPELGIQMAAVLDPTRAQSEWILPSPAHRRVRTVVIVAGVRGEIDLLLRVGPREELRLGRDWLAGRALVDGGDPA